MTTRRELTDAVGERYRRSDRTEKRQILDEFIELTGYHRKHAIRVLCRDPQPQRTKPGELLSNLVYSGSGGNLRRRWRSSENVACQRHNQRTREGRTRPP
ncbi:hypothetical protein QFZ94_000201 [Paraburkholderia sp. JPY465]